MAGNASVHALAIDPTRPSTLYAAPIHGVLKSTDGGSSWAAVNTGLQFCVGDCNDDGTVTIDHLLVMVNIARGVARSSECFFGDDNGDGRITVDEIVTAVNNALSGCGVGE